MLRIGPSPLLHCHRNPHPRYFSTRSFCWCSAALDPLSSSRRVLVISGPTAVGKSSLALEAAKRLNGEIISADSVQVYEGLDIGSAKTPLKDRQGVPHHLIDIVHPEEDYSVGHYLKKAREATDLVLAKKRVPILVGGTGMYLRWYLYGPPDAPKSRPEIRAMVEEEIAKAGGDWDKAVQILVDAGDPDAKKTLPNDWYRLVRRFEVLKATGSPRKFGSLLYSEIDAEAEISEASKRIYRSIEDLDYEFVCFFLYNSRGILYDHIDQRCEEMLTGDFGLLREASWLLDLGMLPNTSPASRAIGYRQAMEYLVTCREADGRSSPEQFLEFVAVFQRASRNFAKRQLTWFRQEPLYHWIDASQQQDAILDFIIKAYNDPSILTSPASKEMLVDKQSSIDKKNKLRVYKPRKKLFQSPESCTEVLDWISKTQRRKH